MIADELMDISFQQGNIAKLRFPAGYLGVVGPGSSMRLPWEGNTDVFGLGQQAKQTLMDQFQQKAWALIVSGLVIGYVGVGPLEGSPFGLIAATSGGFLVAAGLVPFILGAL